MLVADLTQQGIPPLDPLPEKHRDHGLEEVVFGDLPMQSARWPNEEFIEFDKVIDSGASGVTHWVSRTVYRPGSFQFPGDRAKLWDFTRGVWLHGFWCYEWSDEVLKAASYDPATGELRLAAKHAYGIGSPSRKDSKHPFYALHVFEELDRPGEYYIDRQNNRVFFWPPDDVTKQPVRLTRCRKPLIRADGSAYLTIRDLTIENGCDAAIVMNNGQHCRVENCLIRNTGRAGISLSGSHMAAVRCEVTRDWLFGHQHSRRRPQDADARPMCDRELPHPPRWPVELGRRPLRVSSAVAETACGAISFITARRAPLLTAATNTCWS